MDESPDIGDEKYCSNATVKNKDLDLHKIQSVTNNWVNEPKEQSIDSIKVTVVSNKGKERS